MLIDASQAEETRMAIIEDDKLLEYESEVLKFKPTKGNIYLAKIVRVEPSLQAAFVDYGAQRHGFLAYNEIHPDYFKIPTSDKEKILAEEHETSSNLNIDDVSENEFINDSKEEQVDNINNRQSKGFLGKVFDFFNYKPLEDDHFKKEETKRSRNKKIRNFKPKVFSIHKKYSIQEVIKRNQVILIQVVKEERGNKGAAVTTRLSLAGKYCVLMPNTNKGGGVSRKIYDVNLRKKLKDILLSLNINKGMGVIIRTAGQNMKKTDISRDYKALLKLWNDITAKTVKSTAPSLINEEGNLLKRSVRDYFSTDISEVLVNNKETQKNAKEIMKFFMPGYTKFIKLEDKNSLFANFGIEKQINEVHKSIVHLKSGGYLVINQTEALVAIDINSGKYTKQRNIEDTALKTNLEAAEEIGLQVKLRDLAGLIVIDFIDMLERSNNSKVERKIRESIKGDRARIQCGRISNFGLLEMSRQRLKQVINTSTSHKCEKCNGNGVVSSIEFSAIQILRVSEEILINSSFETIDLLVNEEIFQYINKDKKKYFQYIQSKNSKKIILRFFNDFNTSDSIILSNKEVIYRNCDDEKKVSNAISFIEKEPIIKNNNIKKNHQIMSPKKNDKRKEKNKTGEKILISKKVIEQKQTKESRSSFRAKAEDFNKTTKNGEVLKLSKAKKRTRKTKDSEPKIKDLIENEENNKKHGWWNQ